MAQVIQIGKMWYADMRLDGKRIRRALSKHKPEAERLLKDLVEVRRAQRHGDIVRNMSWEHFCKQRLEESLADQDNATYRAYRRAFDIVNESTHLVYLKQLTPDRLARLKTAWINSGKYGPAAISRSLQALLTAMRWAEDRKYVGMQNWRSVKANPSPARTDYYTREGFIELVPKLKDEYFTAGIVMGRAGLRLGEMLHLEWEDIHFNSSQIIFRSKPHIVSSENPRGWRIKKDKDLKKVRSIPMLFSDLRQHLYSIRKPTGFVLGPNVSRLENTFGNCLSDALKATGIKTHMGKLGFPHLLRHTFGSHLFQIGVPPQKVKQWMGHESITMTERYSHLSPLDTEADIQAVEKLWSTFVPVLGSASSSMVRLTALNADLGNTNLSSVVQ